MSNPELHFSENYIEKYHFKIGFRRRLIKVHYINGRLNGGIEVVEKVSTSNMNNCTLKDYVAKPG